MSTIKDFTKEQAINYINNKIVKPTYFIFSDDLCWAKENLILENSVFIDLEKPVVSLYLMSKCKSNVISNSTFSWWGAWLNQNENKIVVSPQKWFTENSGLKTETLLPEQWVLI